MSVTVYVPIDASALSLGAEAVAKAIAVEAANRGESVRIVRNGSRGLYWLEPLVEVETPDGRFAYGPVQADDVPSLFDGDFLRGPGGACRGGGCAIDAPSPYAGRETRAGRTGRRLHSDHGAAPPARRSRACLH